MKKPSVTKLLDLLNKPRLIDWANKIGLQGIEVNEYRKNKLSSGTNLHSQIEQFLKNKINFSDSLVQFRAECLFEEYEVLGIEQPIETEYFIGRYDIKLKKDNIVYLCDFKSNHTKHYLENYLQLCAYKMASSSDRIAIISIPDFTFMELELKDFSTYEQILINLSNIYNLKQQLKCN
jgi:hypothetical protein